MILSEEKQSDLKMTEILNKLKEIISSTGEEIIYLKNSVVVGKNEEGQDVHCVYISLGYNPRTESSCLTAEVIFDFKEDDLYGTDCDFTPVIYYDEDKGIPRFLPEKWDDDYPTFHEKIKIDQNAIELILSEIESSGKEWLDYQKELQNKSVHYVRTALKNFESGTRLTWDEEVDFLGVKGEIEHLMYRRPINYDLKRRDEMLAAGEEKFRANEAAQLQAMKDSGAHERILEGIKNNLKKKKS